MSKHNKWNRQNQQQAATVAQVAPAQPAVEAPKAEPSAQPAPNNVVAIKRDTSLELFGSDDLQYDLFRTGERKNSEGTKVVGLSIGVKGKKDMAKLLGLSSKDAGVVEAMLRASDQLKAKAAEKVLQIATSKDWTGKTARTSVNKNGELTATFTFKTLKRGVAISQDQIIRVLAGMTDEEQNALLNAALALQQETVDMEAPETQPSAPETQPETAPEQTENTEAPAVDNEIATAELANA